MSDLYNAFGDRFDVFCGVDDLILESLALGVTGWVRNLPGGGVEAILEGDKQKLGELLNLLKTGPAQALVSGMDISEVKCKGYEDFKVVY